MKCELAVEGGQEQSREYGLTGKRAERIAYSSLLRDPCAIGRLILSILLLNLLAGYSLGGKTIGSALGPPLSELQHVKLYLLEMLVTFYFDNFNRLNITVDLKYIVIPKVPKGFCISTMNLAN